jgi:DNA polymerase III delta prime subunit
MTYQIPKEVKVDSVQLENKKIMFEYQQEENNHSLWVEKYRPNKLEDYVGNEHLKSKVETYLESGDVPHLLLYGRAGTGKTTLAKLIVNSLDCDYIIINASDENNVDTVRNKVKNFASSMGFKPFKIIIMDEFDYMSQNAQAILRNLMETFSKHCRFILTCNYVEKVIEPIQSRCQSFQIIPPTKKDVAIQMSKILKAEGVEFDVKDLVPIIDASYPDIRKVINTCQLNSHKGKLKVDVQNLLENDYKLKVLDILKSNDDKRNKYMKLRQAIIDSRASEFSELYTLLYDKVDEYAADNTSGVILILGDSIAKSAVAIDKEIIAASTLIQILNVI